jgi:hypothetical protein
MASTYSNLKIQLMTTGENSTTWGDVTNVNLGTALEEAIVGSSDVTFASANVTLTLSNTNASQAARNMRLRCTGTTGGSTRNLVVPSIEKPYIVLNDCADSILVKTSAGNGITVPAGKTMWVYSNGTDVVDVTTHLTSLTLATALPVLSGGTGSNTASGARTNLGLGTIATQNSNAVTITGGSITGITDLAVADGGTGASTAADARTNLGLGSLAVLSSINNTNWSGTALAVANGGTGATDAATARTNLGAGTVTSVAGAGTVNGLTLTGTVTSSGSITLGGTLSGVSLTSQVSGTLPIANGGTNATTAGGARTELGATTLGGNLFTITNPSAVTFPRFNADNTVSALDAATFRSAIGAGTSSTTGTVTSVAGTGTVNGLTLTGTVTSSGSLTLGGTLTGVNLTSQVTGTLPIGNGGTGITSTPTNGQLLIGNGTGYTAATITAGSGVSVTNGAGSITIAATGGTGTVTSVAGTGTVNGITLSGTVTSSGSLTLGGSLSGVSLTTQVSGTLPIANGGTGSTSTTYCSLTANVTGTLPVANGGSGATTLTGILKGNGTSAFSAATAGTDYVAPGGALGTPSSGTLTNCTFPTLNQNTTGSAGSLATTNFSIVESGGVLYFKYGSTNIAKLESNGAFTALNNVTAYGSI